MRVIVDQQKDLEALEAKAKELEALEKEIADQKKKEFEVASAKNEAMAKAFGGVMVEHAGSGGFERFQSGADLVAGKEVPSTSLRSSFPHRAPRVEEELEREKTLKEGCGGVEERGSQEGL